MQPCYCFLLLLVTAAIVVDAEYFDIRQPDTDAAPDYHDALLVDDNYQEKRARQW